MAGQGPPADWRRHPPESLGRTLADLAAPVVADHGAELVDVEVRGSGSYSVRLLVHRDPGVTVDQCEAIAREVSDLFDVEDPVPGRYRLEVTSPGLDRPLRSDGDFRRARNRRLKVITADGCTQYGRLLAFDGERLELEEGGRRRHLERPLIARATIEVEL